MSHKIDLHIKIALICDSYSLSHLSHLKYGISYRELFLLHAFHDLTTRTCGKSVALLARAILFHFDACKTLGDPSSCDLGELSLLIRFSVHEIVGNERRSSGLQQHHIMRITTIRIVYSLYLERMIFLLIYGFILFLKCVIDSPFF